MSRHVVPALLLALLIVAPFVGALASGTLLAPNDGTSYFVPAFSHPGLSWDPYLFSGFPSVGDPQAMLWYPPARLLAIVPGAWNAFVLSGYVLAAWFMYAYVYALTRSRPAGAFSAITFSLGGFLLAHLSQINVVHSAMWAPLALLGLENLARRESRTSGVLLTGGAVALSALAGHPQTLLYMLLVIVPYAALRCRNADSGRRFSWQALASIGLGLGAAAILLMPARELADLSVRSAISEREFLKFSLPVRQWPQLLLPYVFGGLDRPYEGRGFLWEITGYMGMLPMLCALGSAGGSARRGERLFFAGVAAGSLVLVFGSATPLGPLTHHIPILGLFRALGRHFLEFGIALSVLGGLGFAELVHADPERSQRARRWMTRVALPAMTLLLCAGIVSAAGAMNVPARTLIGRPSVWLPMLHLGAAGVAISLPIARVRWVVCLALLSLDVATFAYFNEWRAKPATREVFAEPAAVAETRRVLESGNHRWTPLLGVHGAADTGLPNRSRIWRLESTAGYNPLRLKRYSDLLGLTLDGVASWRVTDEGNRVLDLLSSKVLALNKTQLASAWMAALDSRWRLIAETDEAVFFENLNVLPRAWIVRDALVLPPETILEAIRGGRLPDGRPFDPRNTVLLESFVPAGPGREARGIDIVRLDPGRIDYRLDPGPACFAVLSEIHHPGWTARADGVVVPIVRCDYALCGVSLPAGTQHLELAFRPRALRAGAGVSALSVAGLILFALLLRRGTRSAGP